MELYRVGSICVPEGIEWGGTADDKGMKVMAGDGERGGGRKEGRGVGMVRWVLGRI